MGTEKLAISVETYSPQYAEALEQARLRYDVYKSSRRWVYLTPYLPSPVAGATAHFLQQTILPEMFLEYLDTAFESIPGDDRLQIFQDNLDYLQNESFTRGTQALIQPSIEEERGLSIEGWLRFRGKPLLQNLVAQMAREGLRALRLERALHQFRSLRAHPVERLVLEGMGNALVVKDPSGIELFREYMDGYLDTRLQIDREDLAVSLVRALAPAKVELVNVSPAFRRRMEKVLATRPAMG